MRTRGRRFKKNKRRRAEGGVLAKKRVASVDQKLQIERNTKRGRKGEVEWSRRKGGKRVKRTK